MWGSELTTEVATLYGGGFSIICAARLQRNLCDLRGACVTSSHEYLLKKNINMSIKMADHQPKAPMWLFNVARRASLKQCAPWPQACRHTPSPAGPPEAHAEILCPQAQSA